MAFKLKLVFVFLLSLAALPTSLTVHAEDPLPTDRKGSRTLSENFDSCDFVFFARRTSSRWDRLLNFSGNQKGENSNANQVDRFEVLRVAKGNEYFVPGAVIDVETTPNDFGKELFFFAGKMPLQGKGANLWTYRSGVTEDDERYLTSLFDFDQKGVARLEYFMGALEHPNGIIRSNAHSEFSLASDEDLIGLKDQMDRELLLRLLEDKDETLTPMRGGLYFAMLSICGEPSDIKRIESWLLDKERPRSRALKYMISCYLSLKAKYAPGDLDGLQLVNRLFLEPDNVDYMEVFAAIQALRHYGDLALEHRIDGGEKSTQYSLEQIVASIRLVLKRPLMADMVILDLAKFEDWSSMEAIANLYKGSTANFWVRVPAVVYMQQCPRPEAKGYLTEFDEMDPESVKRAQFFFEISATEDKEQVEVDPKKSEPMSKFLRPNGRQFWGGFGC